MTIRHNIFSHNNNGYHSNNSTFSNKIGVIYLETGLHLVTEIHAKYLKKKKNYYSISVFGPRFARSGLSRTSEDSIKLLSAGRQEAQLT